jgi:hypothetical protein
LLLAHSTEGDASGEIGRKFPSFHGTWSLLDPILILLNPIHSFIHFQYFATIYVDLMLGALLFMQRSAFLRTDVLMLIFGGSVVKFLIQLREIAFRCSFCWGPHFHNPTAQLYE